MKKQLWRAVSYAHGNTRVFWCLLVSLFSILPTLWADQTSPDLACLSNINVTLNEQCQLRITPSMVLTGGALDESAVAQINIDQLETDTVSGCGVHTYSLEVLLDQTVVFSCWGSIIAEDNTPPALTCPPGTSEATLADDMQNFTGVINAEDPSFSPASFSCYSEASPPIEAGPRNYEIHHFNVSTPDVFTFISTAEFDGIIALYQGEFFPHSPCQNLIARSDQTYLGSIDEFLPVIPAIDPSFRLSLPLLAGIDYTLVVTTRPAEAGGNYNIAIFADDDSRVLNLSKTQVLLAAELICLDVEDVFLTTHYEYSLHANGDLVLDYSDPYRIPQEIRQLLDYTGHPEVSDNCSQMLVTVYDELEEEGDCGNWIITRYFEIRDRYLSPCQGDPLISSCIQTIIVRKPNLNDVVFPPISTVVECDEGYPTDGEVGGPDDNPDPSLTGYPYLSAAFNFYDLNQSICNIGASYSDEPRIEECPGTYYFRREWTFIDWCDLGNTVIFDQLIKVGDFTGPILELIVPDYNQDGEPDQAFRYSSSPASCEANLIIPVPNVIDGNGCAAIAEESVRVIDQFGQELYFTTPGATISLPLGNYQLDYCATDECDNTSCKAIGVEIYDGIEPTAVCNDAVIVSLGGGDESATGTASLSADQLDEGSSDHCSEVSLSLRRDNGEWLPEILFTCEDIGDTITVTLLVTDEYNNSNSCWLEVIPEDKLLPYCFAPEDYELSCVDWPLVFAGDLENAYEEDFSATSAMMSLIFGTADGSDNCAVDTIAERTPSININECGWGSITRRFEAWQVLPAGDLNQNGQIDADEVLRSTNTCDQVISLTEEHDFLIDFPEDSTTDCVDPDIALLNTAADGCDVLSINQGEPVRFSTNGEECYKVSISYDIINWCLWDGEYEGAEILRRTEDDGEELPSDFAVEGNERPVLSYTTADGAILDRQHQDRDGDSSLPNDDQNDAEGEAYIGDLNAGRWKYTQFIKVYDNTPPQISAITYQNEDPLCPDLETNQFSASTNDCTGEVIIDFRLGDDCEGAAVENPEGIQVIMAEIDLFASDNNGNGKIDANEFVAEEDVLDHLSGSQPYVYTDVLPLIPPGSESTFHTLRIVAEDACGNQTSAYIDFIVLDCKAPAPVCINGLSATLAPTAAGNCEASIWASDFIGSEIYDCTGQGPDTNEEGLNLVTQYAIYRASEVEDLGGNFVPDPNQTSLVLNESDDETTIVYVYAFDEAGNYDYCETYIIVQTHADCIPAGATVAGRIQTPDGTNVPNVNVSVSGDMPQTAITDYDGHYLLHDLVIDSDVSITPYLNSDPLNGVTTFDLVLIAKHILGIQPLDSPYKMIAADANGSGSVSTLDMIIIRKLILTLQESFSNSSWRFIPSDYVFPDPAQPWSEEFPELININNLTGEESINFKAIKVGDVNDSAGF